jgi:adenine-specific DNA-methyltransferase
MRDFISLRAAAGLSIQALADEFCRPLREVVDWDSGLIPAPAEVLQSLAILSAYPDTPLSSADLAPLIVDNDVEYDKRVSPAHRKRYGQVFTPESVADLMADWILQSNTRTILDPALGTGMLVTPCLRKRPEVQVTGIEVDPVVLNYVDQGLLKRIEVIQADALRWTDERRFDAITMNPPYIRHRELKGHDETRRSVAQFSGCPIPKSANLYVDFVLKACTLLKEDGRGAFLIPAEWMSANFSSGLKRYLLDTGMLRSIVTFSNCSKVFDGALTTASLLLVQKGRTPGVVNSHFLQSVSADQAPRTMKELGERFPAKSVSAAALREASKWEPCLRGDQLAIPRGWTTLGELASTRRGIATGCNDFFLVSRQQALQAGISENNLVPCIGRTRDVQGVTFSQTDFIQLDASNSKVWLIDFKSRLSPSELEYIKRGDENGVSKRYLLKTRSPWYSMEQRQPAPVWAGVFGRGALRFVYNAASAKSLTNFHCVYPTVETTEFAQALTVLLNSEAVRSLMASHQRGFGGGLAKFEPHDLKSIPVPDLRKAPDHLLARIASQLPDFTGQTEPAGLSRLIEELVALASY